MKRLNPFDSQLSPLERVNQARSRLRFSVLVASGVCASSLTILLLLQGCGQPDEKKPAASAAETNANVMPTFTAAPEPTATPQTNASVGNPPPMNFQPLQPITTNPAPAEMPTAAGMRVHAVEAHDSFSSLAKKYTVSVKAIQDANPGVDSKKLKLGQKLNIPASSTAAAPANGATPGANATTPETGGTTYAVKSGDTLTRIASRAGVSVKALKAANNLTTDGIKVGQKLKIPAKAGGAASTLAGPAGSRRRRE